MVREDLTEKEFDMLAERVGAIVGRNNAESMLRNTDKQTLVSAFYNMRGRDATVSDEPYEPYGQCDCPMCVEERKEESMRGTISGRWSSTEANSKSEPKVETAETIGDSPSAPSSLLDMLEQLLEPRKDRELTEQESAATNAIMGGLKDLGIESKVVFLNGNPALEIKLHG